ncbi:hypothetical protein DIPPA_07268 [Diplonema papillatum]|nr:hypothetical protein DIPPA_07268 [Diplonema papillatum]
MTPRQPSEASYAYTPDEVSLLNDPQPAAAANVLRNRSFAADSRAARSPSLLSSQPDAGSLSRGNSWSSQKGYGRVYPAMSEMSCPQTPQEYAFAPAAVGTPGSTGLPPHRGVGSRSNSFVHRARSSSQLSNEWWEPGEHAPNAHPRIAAQEADEDARVAVARQLSLQEAQTGFNATMPVGRNGLASLAVSEASQQSNDLHPPAETDHAQAIDLGSLYHNPSFSTRKPDEPRPTHTPVPPARSAASSETHESRPAISTPKYEPASSIVLMPKADQVADPAQAGFETPVFASTPPVAEGSQPTLAAARADPHPPPPGTVVLIESSQSFRQLLPGGGSPQEAAEAGEAAEAQRRGRDPADDEGKVLSAASSPASVPDTVRRLSVSARRLSPPRSPLGPGSADQWKARALAAEAEVVVLRTGPANPARHAALARERDLWKTDAMAAKDALTQQREVGGRPAKGGKAAGKKAQDASRTKSERAPAKQAGLGYGTPHPSFQHGGKPQPPVFLTPTSPDNAGSPPLGFKPALADRVFDTTAYRGISPVATPSTHPHPSFLRTIDDIERDSSASDSGAKPRPTRTQRKPAHHRSTSLPSKPRPSPQTRGSGAREDAETPRKPWSISGMGTSPYRKPPVPMPSPSRGANPPKAVKPDAGDEPRETPSTGQPSPPKVTGAKPFVSVPFVPEQPWVPPPCKSTSASPPRERSGSAPPEACSPPEKRDWRQPSSPQSVEAIPGGTYGYTAVPKGGGAPAAGLRGRSTSPQNRPVFAAPGRQPDRAAGNRTDPPALRPSRSRSKGREGGDHGASPPRGLGGGGLQGVLEKALSGSEAAGGGNFFGARLHAEQSPGCVPPGGRVPSGRSILRTPGRHHVGGSPPARGHSEPQSMSARDSLSHLSGEEAGGYVSPQPALHSLDTMQPELRRYSAYSATPRGEPRSHPYMSTPPSAPPARSSTEPFTLVQRVSMPRTDPLHWSQQIYNPEFSLPGDRSPSGGSQQQGTGVQTTFHFIPSLASGAAPPWGVWGQKEVVVVDRAAASFGPADYPRLSLLNQPRTSPMRPYRASSMSVGDVSSAGPPLLSA